MGVDTMKQEQLLNNHATFYLLHTGAMPTPT